MKGQMFPMKKETLKLLPLIFIALLLFVGGFLLLTGGVGVPRSRLEEDLRTSQNIPDDWTVTSSVSDSAAVFLYYPPAQNRYGWSIYINHPGLSFGHFFRGSLVAAGIHDNKEELPAAVEQIPIGDSGEIAYVSLNLTGIVRAEIDNGADTQTITLDESKPFAILVPPDAGFVTFYDKEENPAEILSRQI